MHSHRAEIRRLMISVNVIDGICEQIAKKMGIKENTLTLFYALDDGLPHSQKEICKEWLLPKTTLNTIVAECVRDGLMVLRATPHRKEKEILLTDQGRTYAKSVLSQVYALEERAMEKTLAEASPAFIQAFAAFSQHLKSEARSAFYES